MNITHLKTKHGRKSVLTYWYKGFRYRPRLKGVNLTPDQEKQAAHEAVAEIHRLVEEAKRPRAMTFAQAVPLYEKELAINQRIDVARTKSILDLHLLPFLGERTLPSLKKEDGLDYIAHRRKEGAAEGTIEREWAVLMAVLNSAVDNECLDRNRLQKVRSPKGARRKRIATSDEIASIRETVRVVTNKRDRAAREDVLRMMDVALNTGLRVSKILAIDEKDSVLLPGGWWLNLPEARSTTKDNPEMIPLNRQAAQALQCGVSSLKGTRVFGRWKDSNSFKQLWIRMLKQVGIQDLHFHDLRHTFATWLQDRGVPYEIRQILLGHRLKGTTFEYSHGGKKYLREAVKTLDSVPLVAPLIDILPQGEWRKSLKSLVPRDRIELSTPAFSGLCSAN